MKNQTMSQYLIEIKTLVNVGVAVNVEDNIMYTLNGFPCHYQSFKTTTCTMLNLIALEYLYSLWISEDIEINAELAKELNNTKNSNSVVYK